jgi:hypothetical protein
MLINDDENSKEVFLIIFHVAAEKNENSRLPEKKFSREIIRTGIIKLICIIIIVIILYYSPLLDVGWWTKASA